MSATVTFINCFTVPAGREDRFLELWTRVNAHMSAQPGYLDHHLHRALSDGARYGFVNIAHWSSADAWRAAHDARFRELVAGPEWAEFPSTPGLFEVVHTGSAAVGAEGRPGTG